MKMRPGDGLHRTPRPSSRSTLIFSHVRAIRAAYVRATRATDTIACGGGAGIDTLQSDPGLELSSGCEAVEAVGVLRLTPGTVAARSGRVARLAVSWRHPRAWQQVGRITVHVRDGEQRVGEVTISPRAGRMVATGAVELTGRASRLRRSGETVRAQLAMRLDPSLAGRRLTLDVEAVDLAGHRQLELAAGTIRVAE